MRPAPQIAQEARNGPGCYQWCGRSVAPNHYQRPSTIPGEAQPATFRTYARQAGFSTIEILPIDNDLFRFYRLAA